MKKTYFIALLIVALFVELSSAANIELPNFSVISNVNGLPSDITKEICQDNLGYIWIGTDNGVARYDGYTIKTYDDVMISDGVLRTQQVFNICVDKYDKVWVSTNNGIYQINSRNEKVEKFHDDIFQDAPVRCCLCDDDDVWIATTHSIYRYNQETHEIERYVENAVQELGGQIRSLSRDPNGNIWIRRRRGGSIYDKETKQFIKMPLTYDGKNPTYTSIYFEGGRSYVTTWEHGIYEVTYDEGYQNIELNHLKYLKDGIATSIVKDDLYGYYWISSLVGIYIAEDLHADNYMQYIGAGSNGTSLSNEEVWCSLYSPAERILWFGTSGGGINQLSLGTPIIRNNRLNDVVDKRSTTATSIYNHNGELWIGLKSSVMVWVDKTTGETKHHLEHPWLKKIDKKKNSINKITYIPHRNEIWLGSRYDGVTIVKLDGDGEIVDLYELNSINSDVNYAGSEIKTIFVDSKERIFVSCGKGLYLYTTAYNGALIAAEVNIDDISKDRFDMTSDDIIGIVEGYDGEIIFATKGEGVWRSRGLDGDPNNITIERVDVKHNDIKIEESNSLYRTSDSSILLATQNYGLARYDRAMECFVVDSVFLQHDIRSIYSIIEDPNKNMWFGTDEGVVRHNTNLNNLTTFTHQDGLFDNIYINNSVAIDNKGRLLYGGYNGYSMINPKSIHPNKSIQQPIITDIVVSYQSLLHSTTERGSYVERDEAGNISALHVESGDNNISIEFSALSLQNPEKNSYEIRLKGYETAFRYATLGEHRDVYSNLRSGQYTFEIYASNNSGFRSQKPTTLDIYVYPEWYNTTWARCIWVSIILLVIGAVVYFISMRIRFANSMSIAKIEKEKMEELNSAKLQFFSNVSHELLTPLSIISCGVDDLKDSNDQHDKLYGIIRGNINRLMTLTEQILEFRKAETGNLKLQVEYGDIRDLILSIANDDFMLLIRKKELTLSIDCQVDPIYGYFDKDKITKIVYNLLSNAYKYNIERGEISLRLKGVERNEAGVFNSIRIEVSNTGNVISDEQMKSLFTRFYDGAYRQFNTKGVGIGLSLTKDLVELHKGEISVDSSLDRGTTFSIVIPITKESYITEESEIDQGEVLCSTTLRPNEVETIEEEESEVAILAEDIDLESLEPVEGERYTILLAEDDVDCQYVVERYISRRYDMLIASNGREALELAIAHNPDVIVSDVVMPEMDGYELCAAIKESVETSHIPVILLTAKIAKESRIEGLSSGAEAYMTKPIQLDILVAQIESLINSRLLMAQKFKSGSINITNDKEYTSFNELFLKQAIDVIHNNMSNCDFNINDLQEALNVTKSTLYRKLKVLTNMSPNEFIRHLRLYHARNLLLAKGGSISISEVSFIAGFNTPRYFSMCFKKEFGITPSQLLEQNGIVSDQGDQADLEI